MDEMMSATHKQLPPLHPGLLQTRFVRVLLQSIQQMRVKVSVNHHNISLICQEVNSEHYNQIIIYHCPEVIVKCSANNQGGAMVLCFDAIASFRR